MPQESLPPIIMMNWFGDLAVVVLVEVVAVVVVVVLVEVVAVVVVALVLVVLIDVNERRRSWKRTSSMTQGT